MGCGKRVVFVELQQLLGWQVKQDWLVVVLLVRYADELKIKKAIVSSGLNCYCFLWYFGNNA
jgi:hypothetical protein